jgi:hypothetical protein
MRTPGDWLGGALARCVLLLPLVTALPAAAAAQDPSPEATERAAVLAAARDQKAAEIAPPERPAVEKALYWYDNQYLLAKIFGGWNGIHLAGGDFPAGAGMKFGVGYTRGIGSTTGADRQHRVELDTAAAYSTRGYTRGMAALSVNHMAGAPIDLRVRGQYYEFPQEDFFGLGQDSLSGNRTDYLLKSTETSAELRWKPAKNVALVGSVAYLQPTIGSGTDSRYPSTEELFAPSTIPGFTAQPDFLRHEASAAFDWRDNPQHPKAGGRYAFQLADYRDQNLDAYSFRQIDVDVQQYVPLPHRYRTLALRAGAVLTDPRRGQDVPFFYQPTLGGSQELRGFREFRFRDRNSMAFTAEYRWEASWLLDGALFVDAGKVARERRDLSLRDLDVSYGFGFRVHSNSAFVARLDLAFSREGFIPLLRFEHVF